MGGVGYAAGKLGQAILEFVFPAHCVVCGGSGSFLCVECSDALPRADAPRCSVCWRPQADGAACADCRTQPPPFDGLRAALVYSGAVRTVVQDLKYRGTTVLAGPMAQLMAACAREHGLAAELIVPVPLAGLRQRTRGYNQAEALSKPLGRELGLPVRGGALRRLRNTAPQARSDDARARRSNVEGAFRARGEDVKGRRVLLVDDVTTTGATLAACAAALKEVGASSVWALAFARDR